jgi:hypothetical protein
MGSRCFEGENEICNSKLWRKNEFGCLNSIRFHVVTEFGNHRCKETVRHLCAIKIHLLEQLWLGTALHEDAPRTWREKRRCATLRPPRRLEICGLSARIVLFLSTSSCVYSRFNSACGLKSIKMPEILSLFKCNDITALQRSDDLSCHQDDQIQIKISQ